MSSVLARNGWTDSCHGDQIVQAVFAVIASDERLRAFFEGRIYRVHVTRPKPWYGTPSCIIGGLDVQPNGTISKLTSTTQRVGIAVIVTEGAECLEPGEPSLLSLVWYMMALLDANPSLRDSTGRAILNQRGPDWSDQISLVPFEVEGAEASVFALQFNATYTYRSTFPRREIPGGG